MWCAYLSIDWKVWQLESPPTNQSDLIAINDFFMCASLHCFSSKTLSITTNCTAKWPLKSKLAKAVCNVPLSIKPFYEEGHGQERKTQNMVAKGFVASETLISWDDICKRRNEIHGDKKKKKHCWFQCGSQQCNRMEVRTKLYFQMHHYIGAVWYLHLFDFW